MGLSVISNHAANIAHRNLAATDAEATASLAKLSSGTRVVSAKDDAASLAIGSRLNAEIHSLKQATVNTGQASSMLQIADGAMARVNDILIRMKTLAVQSSSGQMSNTERSMLDTEYQALLAEVDRIANVTEFNGNKLVRGSAATETLLPSVPAAENLLKASDGFAEITLGADVGDAAFGVAYDSASGVLTVTNLATGASQGLDVDMSAPIGTNETQKVAFDGLGVTITLNAAFDKSADILPSGEFTVTGGSAGSTGVISDTGVRVTAASTGGGADLTTTTIAIGGADASTAELTIDGYTSAAVDLTSTGVKTATFTNGDGESFTVEFVVTEAFNNAMTGNDLATLDVGGLGAMFWGEGNENTGSTSLTFKIGTGVVADVDTVTIRINAITSNALGIESSSVALQPAADTAIGLISTALDNLNTSRADLGASQNRLEFAAANLRISIENTEAARSNLLDLDVAAEMSSLTSKQILLQAGVAMLAQANQMPRNLLQLLQG